jgi:hypothetical protein
LLGDNTDGGEVILQPIRFKCVGFWILAGPTCVYMYMKIRMYIYFLVAQNLTCAGTSGTQLLRKTCSVCTRRRNVEDTQLNRILREIFRGLFLDKQSTTKKIKGKSNNA